MSPPLPPPSLRLTPLFDAHCHLQDRRLSDWELLGEEDKGEEEDKGDEGDEEEEKRHHRRLDAIVARARSVGVAGVACCACSERDWKYVAALADRYLGFVYPSFGLHPWFIGERREGWERRLEGLLMSRPEAGVGESGLDKAKTSRKKRELPPLGEQVECLIQHARIARELRRPLTLHCVKAAGPLLDALGPFATFSRRAAAAAPPPGSPSGSPPSSSSGVAAALDNTCVVFHGWQGPKEEVLRLSRLGDGVFFSLGARSLPPPPPPAPPPPRERGREEGDPEERSSPLSHIPLSRLLIETDSPDGFEPRGLGEGVAVVAVAVVAVAAGVEEGGDEEDAEDKAPNFEFSDRTKRGLATSDTKQKASCGENSSHATSALNQPSNVAALLPLVAQALGEKESDVAQACSENALAVFCAPGGGEKGGN